MHPRSSPGPRVRIRVDLAPGCSLGPGKVSLLEAIEVEGSLTLAARRLEMSYRRAWNLLDDLNRSFAMPMVETAVGGRSGGGAQLTESGRALIHAFRELERGTARLAGKMRKFSPPRGRRSATGRITPLPLRGRAGR
jgi:molybdate transport system regulatory protein